MHDAIVQVPDPINEPMYLYPPGSPEKARLKAVSAQSPAVHDTFQPEFLNFFVQVEAITIDMKKRLRSRVFINKRKRRTGYHAFFNAQTFGQTVNQTGLAGSQFPMEGQDITGLN